MPEYYGMQKKLTGALFFVFALIAIVTVAPHVFAQQGGLQYTDSDNPAGPLQGMAWAAGLAIAGVMSGIGVWAAVRRR